MVRGYHCHYASKMNQTQCVQYTVTGYSFKEISRGIGSIEYQLKDEFGNERTVTAMAKLNLLKKVSSVRPIYHRELPLIIALAQTKLNESVIIDFSEFNKVNPRGSNRKPPVSIPSVRVKIRQDTGIQGLSSFADNKLRLFQLMSLAVVGFLVLSYLMVNIPFLFD